MIAFTLEGIMPSKKNKWQHNFRTGQVYLPTDLKKEIDYFIWQIATLKIKGELSREPVTYDLDVTALFCGDNNNDLDNMLTTLLDILQKARVIKNDKQVVHLEADKVPGPKPYIQVQIKKHAPDNY